MQVTLCDRCPSDEFPLQIAKYRVSFARLNGQPFGGQAGGIADPAVDLCQTHYDELWEGHSSS